MFKNSPLLISPSFAPIFRKSREILNLFTFYNVTTTNFTKKNPYSNILKEFDPEKRRLFAIEFMNKYFEFVSVCKMYEIYHKSKLIVFLFHKELIKVFSVYLQYL